MTRPRAIFFGTPEFAVPTLRALCEVAEVALVVTQPDRPKGRGMKLAPPPVKELALARGIPVVQPTKVRTPEFAESLRSVAADVAVVVAYGRILPAGVLSAPRLGCVNVHASLLPKLRGAAPIQWAIVRAERETGVCLMQMDEGLDTGPVIARRSLEIGPDETSAQLSDRLSTLGAELLRDELPAYMAGERVPVPQDHAQASLAPILRKEDGAVDWSQPAQAIHDLVRGFSPWPSAYTFVLETPGTPGTRLKLHRTQLVAPGIAQPALGKTGEILSADRQGIVVACGQGALRLLEVQSDGARRMTAAEFLAGHALAPGMRMQAAD